MVKLETVKVNKIFQHIPTDITKLIELIYAGEKLISNKIRTSQKESEQKYKTWIGNQDKKTNKEITTTNETTKEGEMYRNPAESKNPLKTFTDKSDNTNRKN